MSLLARNSRTAQRSTISSIGHLTVLLLTSVVLLPTAALASSDLSPADTSWRPPSSWQPSPIATDEYTERRTALAGVLPNGVFLAAGASHPPLSYRTFGQEANFRYLTGITEADAALVMVIQDEDVSEMIFVKPRDPAYELWEGRLLGLEGARQRTGISDARPFEQLHAVIDSLLQIHRFLSTTAPVAPDLPLDEYLDSREQITAGVLARNPEIEQYSALEALEQLRSMKSVAELDLLRAAAYISTLAHLQILRTVEPGMNEFEVQGILEYTFFRNGAERPGYPPIVGSGPNSTTLHYRQNDRFMEAGDMLLVDAGASYQGYTADITRTVPVDGSFTDAQRRLYETVLAAKKAAEEILRPGAGWRDLNRAAERVIAAGLADLGLIDSPSATYECNNPRFGRICPQYRLWYMHGLGHGVGLDVHDPDISYFGPVQEGSVFTIEPGIYIRADALDHLPDTAENRLMAERLRPVASRYENIGIRIEDLYIVTENGFERLSKGLPREAEAVEALLQKERIGRRDRHTDVVDWYRAMPER